MKVITSGHCDQLGGQKSDMVLLKDELADKLDDIYEELKSNYVQSKNIGVLGGVSGIALFFFYYARYRNKSEAFDLGTRLLELVFEKINEGYSYPTYCAGIAGAGWVMEHLNESEIVEIDVDASFAEIDEYLHHHMNASLNEGYYDILHGGIGYGIYFLKRYKNTGSEALKSRYKRYIEALVQRLNDLSEPADPGLKWISVIDLSTGKKGYNLSLSHGIASIINFLSRVVCFPEFQRTALPLLKGAIAFVLSVELRDRGTTMFPSILADPVSPPDEGKLAWCYGDLGLGLSLLLASDATKDKGLGKKAMDILEHSTKRKSASACKVRDASPCHGAFGIAHIYSALHQKTGRKKFEESAGHWMQEGLNLGTHENGYAGYMQYSMRDGWRNEVDLLEGISGIGLTIISFLADFDTDWDECLFIK